MKNAFLLSFLITLLFISSSKTVLATTITFIGVGTTLNWASAANWSPSQVPGPGDDVIINNNSSINIGSTYTINSLTLGNSLGTSTPTLIFNYNAGSSGPLTIDSGNLTVGPSATITHTAGTSSIIGIIYINVVSGSADIKGNINVDTKGYAGCKGSGATACSTSYVGGAGHGGTGGQASSLNKLGGPTYDSITQPVDLGSGGGGGRISVNYTTDISSTTYQIYGGIGDKDINLGSSGTLYKKSNSQSNGDLIIDNNNQTISNRMVASALVNSTISFDTITIQNNGNLEIGPSAVLTATSLNWQNNGQITDSGGSFNLLNIGTNLTIPSGAVLVANSPRSFTNLTVNGQITHSSSSSTTMGEQYKTNLTISGNCSIGPSGSINVDAKGYAGSQGPGAPTSFSSSNGGGSYGGIGGATSGNLRPGGSVYGSLLEPVSIGSGGGDYSGNVFGGFGGGAVKLTIGGTLSIISPGTISANGQNGQHGQFYTGGGSGGSIYLVAGTITGTGSLIAKGGNAAYGDSGGGGGGRIAVYYTDNSLGGTTLSIGGSGLSGGHDGAVGTVFKKATSSTLLSTPFDTGDPGTLLNKITWTEDLPVGTDAKFQIRTAPDSSGSPGLWSPWLGPTGASDYYTDPTGHETINATQTDGGSDQWFQYKLLMTSTIGDSNVPSVNNISIEYVVNTPPTISITNLPTQSSDGTVSVAYHSSDPEESNLTLHLLADIGVGLTNSLTSGSTAPITITNASNYPNSGTIIIDSEAISYTSKSGNILGGTITRAALNTTAANHNSGTTVWLKVPSVTNLGLVANGDRTSVWTAKNDILNLEKNGVNLKIMANDGNLANQVTLSSPVTLNLDTLAPTNGDIYVNARTNILTFNATDTNSIFMKISNNNDLSADGVNATSGQWVAYSTTTPWTMPTAGSSVYVSFKDNFSNEIASPVSTAVPVQPPNMIIQDASNPITSEWRLFLSWGIADTTPISFDYYQIYRSNTNSNFTQLTQISNHAQNYYLNSGLDKTKTYYYKITIVDTHGNESSFNNTDFTSGSSSKSSVGLTPDGSGGGDYTPPVITNVSYASLTTTSATITWTTDEVADSKVGYSTDTSYGNEIGTITFATSHTINLTGLSANTKYYFRVISYDAVSNKATKEDSSVQYFTTPSDTSAPIISDIKSVTGDASAGITWATNKAADSKVEYGPTTSYGSNVTALDLVFGHSIAIASLSPGSTYHYRVISIDSNGNTSTSPDYNFTTTGSLPTSTPVPTAVPTSDPNITPTVAPTSTPTPTPTPGPDLSPPSISDISVNNINSISAEISWKTNEDADGRVEYGESTTYERGIAEGNHDFTNNKNIDLIGLSPETTYHYRVIAVDKSGNINTSADATFTTSSLAVLNTLSDSASSLGNAPAITSNGPTTSNITGTSVTINWTTTKKGTSLIYYKIKNSLDAPTPGGDATSFVTTHTVQLLGLSPATTYEYQVKTADVNGNYSISNKGEFTTTLPSITNVRVSAGTENSATINWNTQIPTTSIIEYIDTSSGETNQNSDKSLVTSHQIVLTNLFASTTYTFTIIIKDEAGNTARSDQYSFTTKNDKNGPNITNVNNRSAISSQDKVQTVISWTTSEPSTSKVDYSAGGGTGNYEFSSPENSDFVTSHIVVVSNLKPAAVYRFRTVSKDRSGNTAHSDAYVLLTPQRQVTALDLILQNLEGSFGWAKKLGG